MPTILELAGRRGATRRAGREPASARPRGAARAPGIQRNLVSALPLRLERAERRARRPLQVHCRAAARAVRHRGRSRRAARSVGVQRRVSPMRSNSALREMAARIAVAATPQAPRTVDPEVEERLRALGYVGATVSRAALEDRPRGDPKDTIGLYNLLKLAGQRLGGRRSRAAIAKVRQVLAADPEVIEAHTMLGNMHVKAGRLARGDRRLPRGAGHRPRARGRDLEPGAGLPPGGQLRRGAGRLRARARSSTRERQGHYQLADLSMHRGRVRAGGRDAGARDLALDVDRAAFLVKLGEARIELEQLDAAETALHEAIAAKREQPMAHYNLALVHEARGRLATPPLRRTKRRSPSAPSSISRTSTWRSCSPAAAVRRRPSRTFGRRSRRTRRSEPAFSIWRRRCSMPAISRGAEQAATQGLASTPDPGTHPARPLRARRRVLAPGTRGGGGAALRRPAGAPSATWPARWCRCTRRARVRRSSCSARRAHARPRRRRRPRPATWCWSPSTRCAPTGSAPTATRRSRRRTWIGWRARARSRCAPSAHVPLTRPSHVSLFTGLYPAEHGIRDNVSPPLRAEVPLLAELLQQRGFRHGRVRVVDRAVEAVGPRARVRPLFRPVRDRRRRCPLSEHDSEARRCGRGGSDGLARGVRRRSGALPGCTSTIRTTRTSRPSRTRRATPGARTTAKSRGRTSWSAGSTPRSAAAGLRDDTLVDRHVRSRRRTGRARRGRARVLRLRNDAARPVHRSRPARHAGHAGRPPSRGWWT